VTNCSLGNGRAESRTARAGKNLQHGSPTSIARLPHSCTYRSSGTLIERTERVTNLLDEFNELTNMKLFASLLVIFEVKLWAFGVLLWSLIR